jgi:hypothetical protein
MLVANGRQRAHEHRTFSYGRISHPPVSEPTQPSNEKGAPDVGLVSPGSHGKTVSQPPVVRPSRSAASTAAFRKFLKTLGVSAQREVEKAVREALAEGKLKGNEKFPATGTITLGGIGLHTSFGRDSPPGPF